MRRPSCVILLCVVLVAPACDRVVHQTACSGTTVDLVQRGALTVGVSLGFPPFGFEAGAEPAGLEIDLTRALAAKLGLEYRVADRASTALVPGLLAERFDVAASGLRGPAPLDRDLCTTEPYLRADLAVVVRKAAGDEAGSLVNEKVAVERGSAAEAWAREHVQEADLRPQETLEDALTELSSGAADAAVLDLVIAVDRSKRGDLRLVRRVRGEGGYVLALDPENAGLRDAVNGALGSLRADGTLNQILRRWLGEAAPAPTPA